MKRKFKKLWSWMKCQFRKFICWLFDGGPSCGSGDIADNGHYNDIHLVRSPEDAIGVGHHRAGWPWVLNHLSTIHSNDGILFDDFLEQNFCYKSKPTVYKDPWVAIFHHPKNIPSFGNYRENLSAVFELEEFKESSKNLKLAIALSDDLAEWLRCHLDCKVISLKHPVNTHQRFQWDYNSWNKNKKLCQIGFYLRNTRFIEQIPEIQGVSMTRLWSNMDWLQSYDHKVLKHWENHFAASISFGSSEYYNTRYNYRSAEDHSCEFVLPSKYDEILMNQVVIVDYFECSASNVILECISYNTPVVINRLPAIEQYLGKDYPLFFDHPEEVPELLNRVKEAHEYLKNMDKSDLCIETFKKQILREVNKIKK